VTDRLGGRPPVALRPATAHRPELRPEGVPGWGVRDVAATNGEGAGDGSRR
jgi:hypothetical protein